MNNYDGKSLQTIQGNHADSARILGINRDISTGTTPETIWPTGGAYVWPTVATTVSLVSDDANDTAAGTGAQSVIIVGLDDEFNEINEVVVLAGLTPVVSTQLFFRINRLIVGSAGTSKNNEGLIIATVDSLTTSTIVATDGISLQVIYTIPKKEIQVAHAIQFFASIGKAQGGFASMAFSVTGVNGVKTTRIEIIVSTESIVIFPILAPGPLEVGDDIEGFVNEVSANGMQASAGFTIAWLKK